MPKLSTRSTRRTGMLAGYALLTGLLAYVVVRDLAWLEQTLTSLAALAPGAVLIGEGAIALVLAGTAWSTLAAGIGLWASRRSGAGFGAWIALTTGVLLFPYARIPWATVLGAPAGETFTAPPEAWLLAGGLVGLATIETAICAREALLEELDTRGLLETRGEAVHQATGKANRAWLTASLLVGTALVLALALLGPLAGSLAGGLDLLWVPVLAGLVAGAGVWLLARR